MIARVVEQDSFHLASLLSDQGYRIIGNNRHKKS